MSLTFCPECAHEVSSSAVACPNCGHPFARPVVQPKVIVQELPPEKEGFPAWAFIPLGVLGVVVLFFLFIWMRNNGDEEAQKNVNVRINTQSPANNSRETIVRTDSQPNQVVVPSTSQPSTVVVPPSTSTQTTTTTIPAETVVADKGSVSLEAKILSRSGGAQPVRAEKFYLLNKDLQSILDDADIEDESGQGLVNAFGLSIVYPDRYSEVRRKALAEISKHAVYNALTDAGGKANMKDVKPDSYYLFAITKTGSGFAVWSQPVTIQAGQNSLILEPTRPTEITQ